MFWQNITPLYILAYMGRVSVSDSVCVSVCVSSDSCPRVDLRCWWTDQAQTWWRDSLYPHLNPPKITILDNEDFATKGSNISVQK